MGCTVKEERNTDPALFRKPRREVAKVVHPVFVLYITDRMGMVLHHEIRVTRLDRLEGVLKCEVGVERLYMRSASFR